MGNGSGRTQICLENEDMVVVGGGGIAKVIKMLLGGSLQ